MAMMAAARIDSPDLTFEDHQSVDATLSDYEEQERHFPDMPSQHSGFKSDNESEVDDHSSAGAPWSPPGFRARNAGANASGWFRQDPYGRFNLRPSQSPSRSRQTSPEYHDAHDVDPDITLAANIPLPTGMDSPLKERSPEPEALPDPFATPESDEVQNKNNCTILRRFVSIFTDSSRHPLRPPRRSPASRTVHRISEPLQEQARCSDSHTIHHHFFHSGTHTHAQLLPHHPITTDTTTHSRPRQTLHSG